MRKRLTESANYILTAAASLNGLRRQITDGYQYDKKRVRDLQFVLHNINVSLGALVSALSRFSKLRGPSISPDGLLGGLGYIMPIRTIKEYLYLIVRQLSDIQDTLADELTNPRWNLSSDIETKKLLKEKKEVEEKVEDVEKTDNEDIRPEDVVTTADEGVKIAQERNDEVFKNAVKNALVDFWRKK